MSQFADILLLEYSGSFRFSTRQGISLGPPLRFGLYLHPDFFFEIAGVWRLVSEDFLSYDRIFPADWLIDRAFQHIAIYFRTYSSLLKNEAAYHT